MTEFLKDAFANSAVMERYLGSDEEDSTVTVVPKRWQGRV
jgi:hypothetical protein